MATEQTVTKVVIEKGAGVHPFLLELAKADFNLSCEAMLKTQLPITLMLLSVLSLGCTDSGTPINSANSTANPTSNGSPTTGFNINAPYTGEIWTPDGFDYIGTTRFNLQTGKKVKVTDTWAFPTRDGSAYVEVYEDYERGIDEYCSFLGGADIQHLNVKDTRTGSTLGEIRLVTEFGFPVRLSPDAERVALRVAENNRDCGSSFDNKWLTVMSKDGEELYRHTDDSIISYDWHPDGRLVILKKYPAGGINRYGLQIETEPGSFIFDSEGLLGWNPAPDVIGYTAFRVSPNGREAVLEEVVDASHIISTATWRNSRTRHFKMFEANPETAMFVYEDEQPRVNAPIFSPDGQHILVVEGESSAAVGFNLTSLELDSFDNNPLLGIDELGTASIVAAASAGTAYIVSANQKLQPMPPKQYTETIRPVLALTGTNNQVNTVSFSPTYDLTWTPVID